jgi:hypothetical protein
MTAPQNMSGGYKYNEPLGEQMMSEFFIELDPELDINDYQIEFVRPASQNYQGQIKNSSMDYYEFISIQYVMLKKKLFAKMQK